MGTYGAIALIAGFLHFIAFIWILVVGFQRSIVWGILIFLFWPLTPILFGIVHWYHAKKPFLLYVVTLVAMLVPLYMMLTAIDTERLTRVGMAIESGEIQANEAVDYYARLGEAPAQNNPPVPGSEDMTLIDPVPAETGSLAKTAKETLAIPEAIDMAEKPAATVNEAPKQSVEEEPLEDVAPPKQTSSPFPTPGSIKPDPLAAKKQKVASATIRIKPESIGNYKGRYFIITTKDGNEHRGLLSKVSKSTLYLSRKLYGGNFQYQVARNTVVHADMLKEEFVKEFMDR